uniref:Uncharacterized protein n=1 Tax=Vitis vinifera TaxID=29760 RepID=A5CAI1_VITVI|nr:hypothetical protein VITISV_043073 [Vitis vinifera]
MSLTAPFTIVRQEGQAQDYNHLMTDLLIVDQIKNGS